MIFKSLYGKRGIGANDASIGSLTAIKAHNDGIPWSSKWVSLYSPPDVEVFYTEFAWCEQLYHNVTATPAGISYADNNMTSERLTRATHESFPEPKDPDNKMTNYYESYTANLTGHVYNISQMAAVMLPNIASNLLETTIYHNVRRPDHFTEELNLGYALMSSPIDKVSANLAATLTNQIRSVDPGDNYSATTIKGRAVYDETYIRVRWPWMVLPLVEITLSSLLLLATIVVTGGMPLWKTSGLAFLVSGGWEEEEFEAFVKARKGREKLGRETLEEWGKEVKAQLIKGGENEEATRDKPRFERVSD